MQFVIHNAHNQVFEFLQGQYDLAMAGLDFVNWNKLFYFVGCKVHGILL
jgi:hypothetical protein